MCHARIYAEGVTGIKRESYICRDLAVAYMIRKTRTERLGREIIALHSYRYLHTKHGAKKLEFMPASHKTHLRYLQPFIMMELRKEYLEPRHQYQQHKCRHHLRDVPQGFHLRNLKGVRCFTGYEAKILVVWVRWG